MTFLHFTLTSRCKPAAKYPFFMSSVDITFVLWAVLELMVSDGSVRSGGPGRCGASTLALSQLIDLNILEFHTPFKSLATH